MLVVACCAVLALALAVVLVLTEVVADLHRARSAADLAALASVAPALGGAPPDCRIAGRVASLNGARVTTCTVLADGSVLVGVEVPVRSRGPLTANGLLPATVSARARGGVMS